MIRNTGGSCLAPGQKLTEMWAVEFEGKEQRHKPPYRFVTASLRRWYNGTYYGGSGGQGETVDEARLAMMLGIARAICDDGSAFNHDAAEIHNYAMLHWFQGRIKELEEELELDNMNDKQARKIKRKLNNTEELMATWQADHDFWPEEEKNAPASNTAREEDTRIARSALIRTKRVAQTVEALTGRGSEG